MAWERFWTGKLSSRIDCDSGCKRAAAGSLQDAGQQDDGKRWRSPAEKAGHGEDDHAEHQEVLAAEAASEPVRSGQDDGVGHQVAGEDPGGLGVRRREAAGDVGQGHRRDGGVEHLHEGRQHDRCRHQPGVHALRQRVALVRRRVHRFWGNRRRCGFEGGGGHGPGGTFERTSAGRPLIVTDDAGVEQEQR